MSKFSKELKLHAGRLLTNHSVGEFISFLYKNRIPFFGTKINVSDQAINGKTKASIFFRIYEPAEVRFVRKYLSENGDVVELGSSIGVMGSVVSQIQKNGKYVSVEANPKLIDINNKNVSFNRTLAYTLLNKAIDYLQDQISFSINESSLSGKINSGSTQDHTVTVETVTLKKICNDYELDNFTLICDIEGAEIGLFLNDKDSLNKCSKIIIELHDTAYNGKTYLLADLVNLMLGYNFTILDQHACVFVFEK